MDVFALMIPQSSKISFEYLRKRKSITTMTHSVRNSRCMGGGQPESNAVSVYPILEKKHKVKPSHTPPAARKRGRDPATSVEFGKDDITCICTRTEVDCLIDDEDAVVSPTTWMNEPLVERFFRYSITDISILFLGDEHDDYESSW